VGIVPDALRNWAKPRRIDRGQVPGTTTADAERIKKLEQENRELKWANEDIEAHLPRCRGRPAVVCRQRPVVSLIRLRDRREQGRRRLPGRNRTEPMAELPDGPVLHDGPEQRLLDEELAERLAGLLQRLTPSIGSAPRSLRPAPGIASPPLPAWLSFASTTRPDGS
jgi:hypothetical protein